MRRSIALAYLLASLAAVLVPLMTFMVLTLPSTRGQVSLLVALLFGTWFWVTAFVIAIVLPIAALLRRMAWFGPLTMGVAGFLAAAVLMAVSSYRSQMAMSDGTLAPMSLFGLVYGSVMYGAMGAQCALVFWFVFRAIAGPERLLAGSTIQA